MLRTPDFWRKRSFISYILLPFSFLYLIYCKVFIRRVVAKDVGIPVICVGNIVAGGAGKTPTSIALCKLIEQNFGLKIAFVTKGYGGNFAESMRLNADVHKSIQVGDESLILCKYAPTYICHNRGEGAEMAVAEGAEIIILDDGLHDGSIKKDLTILVVDGEYGFGNGFLLPAGPLRESVENGLEKADITLIIGDDKCDLAQKIQANMGADIVVKNPKPARDKPYMAFAAIGRPEKFFKSLRQNNYKIIDKYKFADHYEYTQRDIENLIDIAAKKSAELITTEKDLVRISKEYHEKISCLPIDLQWRDEAEITQIIKAIL